jgi:hypothetical protein
MSIQVVIVRCDEPGCGNTADATRPAEWVGWRIINVPFSERATLVFDYCPKHEVDHR